MNDQMAQLNIPPKKTFLEPAVQFVLSCASQFGLEEKSHSSLEKLSQSALSLVMENNANGKSDEPISIDVLEKEGRLLVALHNRGVPIFTSGRGIIQQNFQAAAQEVESFSLENMGSGGQTLTFEMKLGEQSLSRSLGATQTTQPKIEVDEKDLTIRRMETGEVTALSKLFYFVYGYKYINDAVYFPEKIEAMIKEEKLVPIVASLSDGTLLGHVGLLRWNDNPLVYEPCLGVTHPGVKSRGLFGKIFSKTMETAFEIPMQYCFFDCVTNHDFSQRWTARYMAADMALFIGCQISETQAKLSKLGIGEDPTEMDRYSLLYSVIPRVTHPFGQEIALPDNLGELLGFLLKPFNLIWTPPPRFGRSPSQGHYETRYQPIQKAVHFDVPEAGRQALISILEDWNRLLRNGYQYASIEMPVETPGLGNIYDKLAKHGFFVSGFVPYHFSDKLGIRFQSIGPTKVAFDQIKAHSPTAKQLLEVVKSDYERNHLI